MTAPRIARLEPVSLRDGVYAALRDAFTIGAFAPGETISLRELAADLGTSLTPVREAVRRLVAEGALIDTPSRTLRVPPFDARRMRELKAARLALEPLLLAQAFDAITPERIAELRALTGTPGADGPDLRQNHAFHFALYRLSGSEVLLPMVEALWLQYGAYLNRIIREEAAGRIAEHVHHVEMVDALEAGDLPAAQAALRTDIERSFNLLVPAAEAAEDAA
jgi:DNA-binding GntR family transcriptional regulator